MKIIRSILLLLLALSPAWGYYDMANQPTAVSGSYKIEAETDRATGLYRQGEPVEFRIRLLKDGKPIAGEKLLYSYRGDNFTAGKGELVTAETPVTVKAVPRGAGFLLLKVDYRIDEKRKIYARAGALTDPESIRPGLAAPADFDEFWQKQKAAVLAAPMKPVVTAIEPEAEYRGKFDVFDVQIPTPGAGNVSAYLTVPAGAADRKLPAMICWHAAGVRSAIKQYQYAAMGMMVLDVNAHGLPNGLPGKYYGDLYQGEMKNYRLENAGDRDNIYFNGMFRRLIRALQFVTSSPQWDGRTLIVYGGSQGGAQALVSAGLEPKVSCVIADEPALCDHGALFAKRDAGWPRFIAFRNRKPVDPAIAAAVPYYDAAYFAARINPAAAVRVTTGLIDTTCVPSSVFAAFNLIPAGQKNIEIFPQAIHGAYREFDAGTAQFIRNHLNR